MKSVVYLDYLLDDKKNRKLLKYAFVKLCVVWPLHLVLDLNSERRQCGLRETEIYIVLQKLRANS